ncbi:GNAT family N-acetyltransferase [Novipirellula caenicola]|uniref:N-acetyltransferase domain-containing protein n=1 Tax=Novipirellula caenicola TaxID=1536901 RepID=A0ABP9VQ54_9BACT
MLNSKPHSHRIDVRTAVDGDTAELAGLFRDQAEYQQQLSPHFEIIEGFDWSTLVSKKLKQHESAIFVCQCDQTIVGYISVRHMRRNGGRSKRDLRGWIHQWIRSRPNRPITPIQARNYGFVEDWYVAADWRQQGIGRRLWEAARKWFEQRETKEIDTTIWVDNEPSIQVFEHLGFAPVRVMMRKSLT